MASPSQPKAARNVRRFRLLVIGASGLLVLSIICCFYYFATIVTGTELNTRTWDLRNFSFRRDPFTNYQLSGITHSSTYAPSLWTSYPTKLRCEIDPSIRKYLLNASDAEEHWDLVSFDNVQSSVGDASVLVSLLSARDFKYDEFWLKWTTDHPAKAAILWPAAQHLTGLGLYSKLPILLETALLESTDSEFEEMISETMQSSLLDACRLLAENGEPEQATKVAQIGLTYGDYPALQDFLDSLPLSSKNERSDKEQSSDATSQ